MAARPTRQQALHTLFHILASPRWPHPGALEACIDLLMALQRLGAALGEALGAGDINPVMLGPAGATAVDALVELRP